MMRGSMPEWIQGKLVQGIWWLGSRAQTPGALWGTALGAGTVAAVTTESMLEMCVAWFTNFWGMLDPVLQETTIGDSMVEVLSWLFSAYEIFDMIFDMNALIADLISFIGTIVYLSAWGVGARVVVLVIMALPNWLSGTRAIG